MGNTILAHALFACNHVDLNLENFFSSTGDSHKINQLNQTNLTAAHLIEFPNDNVQCILKIICQEWWEVLRLKLSYSKWTKAVPTLNNSLDFYTFHVDTDKKHHQLWQEFYNAYRDPDWPDCSSIDDIVNLPINIQEEIANTYVLPKLEPPSTVDRFVEWLTVCYYDQVSNTVTLNTSDTAATLFLGNYIQGNYKELLDVCSNVLGWSWDLERDNQFHKQVLQANTIYLNWLEKIKRATFLLVNGKIVDYDIFDLWEQAVILAMACKITQTPATHLLWDTTGRITDKNNLYLNIFTRTKHGKTI